MDFIGIPSIGSRSDAWNKLAKLCAISSSSVSNSDTSSKFNLLVSKLRYYNSTESESQDAQSRSVISQLELHVITAIADNSHEFKNRKQADILFPLLSNYLVKCHDKLFNGPSFLKDELTPWTKLSKKLSLALIQLTLTFPDYKDRLFNTFADYMDKINLSNLYHQLSLIGFIQALTIESAVISQEILSLVLSRFNTDFYELIEMSIRQLKNQDSIDLICSFSDIGFEYSSILFIDLIQKLQVEFLKSVIKDERQTSLMDYLLSSESISYTIVDEYSSSLNMILQNQYKIEEFISASNDVVVNSSLYRRKTCLSIHAFALEIYSLSHKILDLDFNFLNSKVSAYLTDFNTLIDTGSPIALDMITSNLLLNCFGAGAILSESNQIAGLDIVKRFPIIIKTIVVPKEFVQKLSNAVKYCLKSLSKDDTISLIYTLSHILDDANINETSHSRANTLASTNHSLLSESLSVERNDLIPQNVIAALVEITKASDDESITTLVTTLIYQKIKPKSDQLNTILLDGITQFIDTMSRRTFSSLIKYYYEVSDSFSSNTLNIQPWIKFSKAVAKSSNLELYDSYLNGLLVQIISKGDIDDLEHHRTNQSVTQSSKEIQTFLKPLAYLLPDINEPPRIPKDKHIIRRFQDAWFNLSVHGFAYNSPLYQTYLPELLRIAHSSPQLASESTWNRSETSIEMNTILRRGTSKTTERIHKDILKSTGVLGSDLNLSRPGLMFLSCTLMLEMLRTQTGSCSKVIDYLSDPSVIIAKLQSYLSSIAGFCSTSFATTLINNAFAESITIKKVTAELKQIFVLCCHRNQDLQNTAFHCANIILNKLPSSLCYNESAFAVLDILGLLFQSIIDADTNEYEPSTQFKSRVTDIDLLLSDSYPWRKETLDKFTQHATKWFSNSLLLCDGDMKTVLHLYVSRADASHRTINFGVSFALDMASKILSNDREFHQLQGIQSQKLNTTAGFLSQSSWNTGIKLIENGFGTVDLIISTLDNKIHEFVSNVTNGSKGVQHKQFVDLMEDINRVIVLLPNKSDEYCRWIVQIPFMVFNSSAMEHAIKIWLTIMKQKPQLSTFLLSCILHSFEESVIGAKGLYSRQHDLQEPEYVAMEYLPTNKLAVEKNSKKASSCFKSHLLLVRFLKCHFNATMYQSKRILNMFVQTLLISLDNLKSASLHPFARLARFELVSFGYDVLKFLYSSKSAFSSAITNALLDGALSWFVKGVTTPFGNNKLKIKADFEILNIVATSFSISAFKDIIFENKRQILLLFLDDEIKSLHSWINPLANTRNKCKTYSRIELTSKIVQNCYLTNGKLAVNLVARYKKNLHVSSQIINTLTLCILNDPFEVAEIPSAVEYIEKKQIPAIVAWSSAPPVYSIKKFLDQSPYFVQYVMRSIESFDVHLTFFYVPQIVQSMRHDSLGYIRRFIIETANVSQLFAHQIIWNMAANSFKDEESTEPDSIKPILDEIRETMISTFSDTDRAYFEKEFSFFAEVTGISGKLKPYIKKSKPEKKAKIDEEMAKIKVEEGVYLPSNPEGTVVDIDRKSGKPLQSHAKAPFMATFFLKKKLDEFEAELEGTEDTNDKYEIVKTSAIFKVGDDCRQDVLALQLISMFRTIWMTAGVDVYVFPYRVTATAPGCGIIDVLPNSISRDMLGRQAVNGLYEYFISQFGPETSPEFQRARVNFVKSLAAYSIITYLLEIKDRHNGNIMYDSDGHILHIDFGFCFDIVPGGVKFEQSPFKLTKEMVRVMGGSVHTQAYKWFEELCVKCFLACRLHKDSLIGMVSPMLESGLPCFKPATIKHLEERFVPNKTDEEASLYIRGLIKKSFESLATKGYDEFQRLTNGIPY